MNERNRHVSTSVVGMLLDYINMRYVVFSDSSCASLLQSSSESIQSQVERSALRSRHALVNNLAISFQQWSPMVVTREACDGPFFAECVSQFPEPMLLKQRVLPKKVCTTFADRRPRIESRGSTNKPSATFGMASP